MLPQVRFRDERALADDAYEIRVFGVRWPRGEVMRDDSMLAIHPAANRKLLPGIETREPTYGLPALWIDDPRREPARAAGYTLVDRADGAAHAPERSAAPAVRRAAHARRDRALLARVRETQPGLVEELVPTLLSLSDVQKVLQNLLREKVPIRNLEAILEVAGRRRSQQQGSRSS